MFSLLNLGTKSNTSEVRRDFVRATHGAENRPLRIGDAEIPCFVLEDGRRVLAISGMQASLGMARGDSMVQGVNRIQFFVSRKGIKPFITNDLNTRIDNPIAFRTPKGPNALGYEAGILVDLCNAAFQAREAGALQLQQQNIARYFEILVRSFASVGIVALVDEATGYQTVRHPVANQKMLDAFVAKELTPWQKRFSDEFLRHLNRLRGEPEDKGWFETPQYYRRIINNIVYSRIAPGLIYELKERVPRDANGEKIACLYQQLTSDLGHPKLREHMSAVLAVMELSKDYDDVLEKLDRTRPKFRKTLRVAQ